MGQAGLVASSTLEPRLKRLMLLRVVMITTLLLIAISVEAVSETLRPVNPLYYLIEVVRMPLIGTTPGWEMWAAVIGINLVGGVVSLLFFARYRQRIAYWV